MALLSRIGSMVAWVALLSMIATVMATDMTYCAGINTAATSGNHSIYQSDGLCYDFCKSTYAFAVVKDSECWCSDYEPDKSTKVDTGNCNTSCPGYDTDTCGGAGLWGYMLLNKAPIGTKGASSSTTTTRTTATPISTTSVQSSTTISTTSSSLSPSLTSSLSSTALSITPTTTPTTTPTPSLSISIVTEGGTTREKTITVMPSITSTPGASTAEVTSGPSGLSTGQAVGVAVGVLGFFIILGAIGVFLWLRRRRRAHEEAMLSHQNSVRGSSSGMMSTPRTEMTSMWDGDGQSAARRNSRLMPHDPRMDPYSVSMYNRYENKSHESVNTLQDNHDYSRRVLRTTNPDLNEG